VHARSRDFSTAVGDPPAAWILNSGLPAGFWQVTSWAARKKSFENLFSPPSLKQ
jgi:hypothetical protein